jgi:hypothetical protein
MTDRVIKRNPTTNRIVIVPICTGHSKHLQILFRYLREQKDDFSNLHLWLNTQEDAILSICKFLAGSFPWVKLVFPMTAVNGPGSISQFYAYCISPNTSYLKISDETVWMAPGFIDKMFEARELDNKYFLLVANVINHPQMKDLWMSDEMIKKVNDADSNIHQFEMDMWGFGATVHHMLLNDVKSDSVDEWLLPRREMYKNQTIYLACFCWLGVDFSMMNGKVDQNDAYFLCRTATQHLDKLNYYLGDALCTLYAWPNQHEKVFDDLGLLGSYQDIAPKFQEDDDDLRLTYLSWGHFMT